MNIFLYVLGSTAFVLGFHFVLRLFNSGKGDLSTNLHLIRRFQHVLTGVLILLVYLSVSHSLAKIIIIVPSVGFIIFDQIRRKYSPSLNNWFVGHWEWLLRPHELNKSPPAALYFLLGITFAIWVGENQAIVCLSILFLTFCDPAASIFGILIGGIKITPKKSVAGSMASAIFGLFITGFVFTFYEISLNWGIGMIIAFISELITINSLDDNFTIPVISCLLWKAVFYYYEII